MYHSTPPNCDASGSASTHTDYLFNMLKSAVDDAWSLNRGAYSTPFTRHVNNFIEDFFKKFTLRIKANKKKGLAVWLEGPARLYLQVFIQVSGEGDFSELSFTDLVNMLCPFGHLQPTIRDLFAI